ncbi:MAG TPA: hypothetical protein DCF49_00740 [Lachnospiraceae bacterium]|nr:hypothetical protein [Lachnospiraceae bacterium]
MRKSKRKSPAQFVADVYRAMDRKALAILLALELGTLLLMIIYGRGAEFFPAAVLLMTFTAIICTITFYLGADKFIIIFPTALVNIGLMAQVLESSRNISLIKYLFCTVVLCAALFLYRRFGFLLESPHMIRLMMAVQYAICLVTLVLGRISGDGARITFRDMTLLEFVKILYVFVAAGMLCGEKEDAMFPGLPLHKSTVYLTLHTAILSLFFVLCSEMGTLLVILLTYLIMNWVYGRDQKTAAALILVFVASFALFWLFSDRYVLANSKAEGNLPGPVKKLILRFGYALHPERDISGGGYQGTLGLCALALGGLVGIRSERYRVNAGWFTLYGADNDFLFANLAETGGFMLGMLIILMFIGLLVAGMNVAHGCQNRYLQGVAMAGSLLIFAEALIHIGYNLAVLPITGIPLYFCSYGFSALTTGMGLTGVLLAISTGKVRKKREKSR